MIKIRDWKRQQENNPSFPTPRVQAQLAEREGALRAHGEKAAASFLAAANGEHEASIRRLRAVGAGLEAIQERAETDPTYTAKQAAKDAETPRIEYQRLRAELPRIAMKVEDARAINADPVGYAEDLYERFPALAARLPGFPPL